MTAVELLNGTWISAAERSSSWLALLCYSSFCVRSLLSMRLSSSDG